MYFLRKRSYGLLIIIFEKSIFDNQMHIYHGENLKNKDKFLCVKKRFSGWYSLLYKNFFKKHQKIIQKILHLQVVEENVENKKSK